MANWESIWADAGDYLALNPARLEYDARANLQSANAILAVGWDGEAADAFASQMSYIETFMDEQQSYIATSAQAVAMMYAVSVQFRESMYSPPASWSNGELARCSPRQSRFRGRIQGWVDRRRTEFEALPMKLQEPLKKSTTDVGSPDFSYEHFHFRRA